MEFLQAEQAALVGFLGSPGPLRSGMEKFTQQWALDLKAQCASAMATVPRNPEQAADYAAKAQLLDEFWAVLGEQLQVFAEPLEEPTPQGVEE